jgi:hypothetical protein
MLVTFLVALDLSDISTLTETALDIQDDLEQAGHSVESVKPWARPSAQTSSSPLSALPNLVEPPAEPTPPAL